MDQISPIHPGEVLLEDYLKPLGISQTRLAIAMRVPSNRIFESDLTPFLTFPAVVLEPPLPLLCERD